jgi:hypothetical protein
MNALFVTHTPGHLLTAWGIAESLPPGTTAHLCTVADTPTPCAESLGGGHPFRTITSLAGAIEPRSMAVRRLRVRANCRALEELCGRLAPSRIYAFNDARPEVQAALRRAAVAAPGARGVCVEDGAGMYSSRRRDSRSPAAMVLGRLLYGPFFTDVTVHGLSPWIREVLATFPAWVRDDLQGLPSAALPLEILVSLSRARLEGVFPGVAGAAASIPDGAAVLVPGHESVRTDRRALGPAAESLCRALAERSIPLLMKVHPADAGGSMLPAAWSRLPQLPPALPLEALLILARGRVRFLAGDVSTALITARRLSPGTRVVSIAAMLGLDDPGLMRTFAGIGVGVPRDAPALGRFLDGEIQRGI